MKVLGIDSASKSPGLAVLTGEGGREEFVESLGSGAMELLVGRVRSLVARSGFDVRQLERVAVVSGPGSFTGLRAGIAFARGLSTAVSAELVLVPTFEAAAAALSEPGDVEFLLDAGRGEVHRARRRGGALSETGAPLERARAESDAEAQRLPVRDLDREPLALALAAARIAAGGGRSATALPNYGRVSAAEEKLAR